MIKLFSTPHNTHISLDDIGHLLHSPNIIKFEHEFADYVGAKHAVSFNSATSAIYLLYKFKEYLFYEPGCLITQVQIPSILPPVVANAIITSGNTIKFYDDVDWVGHSYILDYINGAAIIDSAQQVEQNQYRLQTESDLDLMIFSFFPTKPIGSCDGGMIVSNDEEVIEKLRILSMNGMTYDTQSWERKIVLPGCKMYMNSIQAQIAHISLFKYYGYNKNFLEEIREQYNEWFGLHNTSLHLYRIYVEDNRAAVLKAKEAGIECGIHYTALHKNPVYCSYSLSLPLSEYEEKHTLSIPFHPYLKTEDMQKVRKFVNDNQIQNCN